MEQRFSDNDSSKRDIPSFIEPRPPLINNPFMRPRPQKATNLMELFEEDSEVEEPELVQVYLRMKPHDAPNSLYEVRSDKCLVTSVDTATAGHGRRTQHNVPRMYTFSRIFDSQCSQKEIFEVVVKENLKKLSEGHNFTLLTYGASGSGKTYTLMGTVSSPGLVPWSLEYVFKLVDASSQPTYKPSEAGADKLEYSQQEFELQWVKRLRQVSAPQRDKYRRMSAQLKSDMTVSNIDLTNSTKYYVWVSFVEIYNEAIYDLLAPPDKRTKLRIREDNTGQVYAKGVTQAFVRTGEEAYDVLVAGKHNLVVAATGVHAHSSRSHCIFTITMLTETEGEIRTSCVRLCDLAGCERARATRNTGARMQESRAINSSLHVLERCLHLLRRNQRQRQDALVPYRESKLTRLLGSGLSGSRGEAVSMVVTLNPSPQYAHETKHVLSLAAVAQHLQTNTTALYASTLESSAQDTTVSSTAELVKLRAGNELLHFELVQAHARNKELLAAMEEKQQESADLMRELVEEAKDMTRQYYEAQIDTLRAEMEAMIDEYEARLAQTAVPAVVSTPTRFMQAKVAHLLTENTLLEDKLARAEQELKHLRSCIDERDEKTYKDTTPEEQEEIEILLTDSEDESDPFNQSLEPIFRKECLDRSKAVKSDNEFYMTLNKNNNEDILESDYEKDLIENDDEESDADTITDQTTREDDNDDTSKNSDNASGVKNPRDSHEEVSMKSILETTSEQIQPNVEIKETIPETLVSKIIESLKKSKQSNNSNSSLRQFEQLEKHAASEECVEDFSEKRSAFGDIKILQEKRTYFDENTAEATDKLHVTTNTNDSETFLSCNKTKELLYYEKHANKNNPSDAKPVDSEDSNPDNVIIFQPVPEKRTDFTNIEVTNKKVAELITSCRKNQERSPSIVSDNPHNPIEPSTMKALLGENIAKLEVLSSIHTKPYIKKQDSIDVFEGLESPQVKSKEPEVIATLAKMCCDSNLEVARKSIEKLVLEQKTRNDLKQEYKLEPMSSVEEEIIIKEPVTVKKAYIVNESVNIVVTGVANELNVTQSKQDNTIEEFENIYKDLSTHRPTEFDLLASQEIYVNERDDKNNEETTSKRMTNNEDEVQNNEYETEAAQTKIDDVKYNLRNKGNKSVSTKKSNDVDEVLLESSSKCESKTKYNKRSLRLRRKRNCEETDQDNEKLKDILNLKKEFSDVTLGLPAFKKEVRDIPSPEKLPGEDENLPPLLGIQSCPSKSVTRSRRKLFTPRAEALEESLSQAGDSNERIYVPRPSYQRARVRRKL